MKNGDFIRKVIRCKDCIHRGTYFCPMYHYHHEVNEFFDMTEDNWFCSEGEKYD